MNLKFIKSHINLVIALIVVVIILVTSSLITYRKMFADAGNLNPSGAPASTMTTLTLIAGTDFDTNSDSLKALRTQIDLIKTGVDAGLVAP